MEFFRDDLSVGERVALYRHLLSDDSAMNDHRRMRRALDRATGGKSLASPRRRERMKEMNERRGATASFDPPTQEEVDRHWAEISEQSDNDMITATMRETYAPLDFSASPEATRLVAEAEQLSFGHLFNPAFAAEISLIDPLPHQRIAVYEHMLAPAAPALPARRRRRRRQDDHDRPVHPRDARAPADPARPDRPARRPGRATGSASCARFSACRSASSPAAERETGQPVSSANGQRPV